MTLHSGTINPHRRVAGSNGRRSSLIWHIVLISISVGLGLVLSSCSGAKLSIGTLAGIWENRYGVIVIRDGWFSNDLEYHEKTAYVPREFNAVIGDFAPIDGQHHAAAAVISLGGIKVTCSIVSNRTVSVIHIDRCLRELNGVWSKKT